jgi:hypothetical protein
MLHGISQFMTRTVLFRLQNFKVRSFTNDNFHNYQSLTLHTMLQAVTTCISSNLVIIDASNNAFCHHLCQYRGILVMIGVDSLISKASLLVSGSDRTGVVTWSRNCTTSFCLLCSTQYCKIATPPNIGHPSTHCKSIYLSR